MEEKQIISDINIFDNTLYESTSPSTVGGVLKVITGPVAEWGSLNRNHRMYSEKLWDRVLDSPYVKEQLSYKTLFGEANHPTDRMEVDFGRVSHSILDMWKVPDRNQIYAKIAIVDTPLGRILNTLYDTGAVIGYSSRANGILHNRKDYVEVDEGSFSFVTFDAVPYPSVVAARPEVTEGVLLDTEETLSDSVHEKLCTIIKESSDNYREVVKDFILSLKGFDLTKEKALLEGSNPCDIHDKSGDCPDTIGALTESSFQIHVLQAEKQGLKEDNDKLVVENKNLRHNLTESLSKISDLVSHPVVKESAGNEDSYMNTIHSLKSKVQGLQDELDEKNIIIESLKDSYDACKALEYENRAIKFRSQGLETSKEEVDSLKGKIQTLQEQVKDIQHKYSVAESTIRNLKSFSESAVGDADRYRVLLEEEQTKVSQLGDRLNEASSMTGSYNDLLDTHNSLLESYDELKHSCEELASDVRKKNRDYKDLKDTVDSLKESAKSYRDELVSVICDSYNLTVSSVEDKLKVGFTKSDVYQVCESMTHASSRQVSEIISYGTNTNTIDKLGAKTPNVAGFFTSRRGGGTTV